MPRTVRMRPRKNNSKTLKVDKACRIGRTYDDYNEYISLYPDVPVRQLDSVEGTRGGSVLLTIHFVNQELQLAFLRKSNDSQSVTNIFNLLYEKMGHEIFVEIFPFFVFWTAMVALFTIE